MNEKDHEKLNINRFAELAERARRSGRYCYSSFHSPSGASDAYKAAAEGEIRLWGGAPSCERVMVRFGDPEDLGYEEEFPIRVLYVSPVQEKFAESLSHRDYLGAILNLGIERDVIGDILVRDKSAYVFVAEEMADYITSGLERVKHTNVKVKPAGKLPEDMLPKLKEEAVTVSSPRLDAVLSKLLQLPRGEAKNLFDAEKVTVNGRLCRNPETILKEECGISVRGYGRFEYLGEMSETKKGKMRVIIRRYV
ncbi:MAG: DbpA RNA binding domain-containing protein [Lachnospiraceae bacterium]|nr:DbpA RNA binding domain-containing protein [Lachnospiraceae bacterium]